jgi:hypothetical protein
MKSDLKKRCVCLRKLFNRNVQRCKRIYLRKAQDKLLSHLENDQKQLWKSIGITGIAINHNKQIPMQVIIEDNFCFLKVV